MTTATPNSVQRRLNLGSGGKADEDFVSFDITAVLHPDVQGDARRLPFADDSFTEIRAWHVLEHIRRESLIECMNECWRVLKQGGVMNVEVPLFPSDDAMADPTHVSFFVARTFDYFQRNGIYDEHRILYGISPWHIAYRERAGMNSIMRLTMEKVAE